jgi:hypothetical protein
MQECFIKAGVFLAICSPIVAIIPYCIYKGDFSPSSAPYSPPDELELRRREHETMLRHEQRAVYARRYKELETQRLPTAED